MKKIVITRQNPLAEEVALRWFAADYELIHAPLIQAQALELSQRTLFKLETAQWIFFTSALGVELLSSLVDLQPYKLASIGSHTTKAILEKGLTVHFEASSAYAKDFAKEWLGCQKRATSIALPQSSLSNPLLAEQLRAQGHSVYDWVLYETSSNSVGQSQLEGLLKVTDVIWTFASPSAWSSFREVVSTVPESHKIAVIGQTTAAAVRDAGYTVDYLPTIPSMEALIETIYKKERD